MQSGFIFEILKYSITHSTEIDTSFLFLYFYSLKLYSERIGIGGHPEPLTQHDSTDADHTCTKHQYTIQHNTKPL